jgi:preprotein translocase subunit SecG
MKAMQRIVLIGAALSALLIGTPVLAQHSSSGGHAAGGGGHFAGHASAARASGGPYVAVIFAAVA